MKKVIPISTLAPITAALAFPSLAQAHSSQPLVYDCAAGISHPFHGWDHLVAMTAVGFLAAQRGGRARWILPIAFLGVMTCAAVAGASGIVLSGTEIAIASSILVLGVLITVAAPLPLAASTAIVGLFAIAHGLAHGAEMPSDSTAVPYFAGFLFSSAALNTLGLLMGQLAHRISPRLGHLAGIACLVSGGVLLLG